MEVINLNKKLSTEKENIITIPVNYIQEIGWRIKEQATENIFIKTVKDTWDNGPII